MSEVAGNDTSRVITEADAACDRLDFAILGFNRHSRLLERHRERIDRVRQGQAQFIAGPSPVAHHERDSAKMSTARERCRDEHTSAQRHRVAIEHSVRRWVHLLRDAGTPPERVLVLVKQRFAINVCAEAPAAPRFEALELERQVSAWVIAAYFPTA